MRALKHIIHILFTTYDMLSDISVLPYTVQYEAWCMMYDDLVQPISVWYQVLDFGGFDASRILMLRGWIFMSIGNFPEVSSQAILVGMIFVGRLGVPCNRVWCDTGVREKTLPRIIAESGAALQFLLLGRVANSLAKGVFFVHRHRYGTMFADLCFNLK